MYVCVCMSVCIGMLSRMYFCLTPSVSGIGFRYSMINKKSTEIGIFNPNPIFKDLTHAGYIAGAGRGLICHH